jgi:hypothetical protein
MRRRRIRSFGLSILLLVSLILGAAAPGAAGSGGSNGNSSPLNGVEWTKL